MATVPGHHDESNKFNSPAAALTAAFKFPVPAIPSKEQHNPAFKSPYNVFVKTCAAVKDFECTRRKANALRPNKQTSPSERLEIFRVHKDGSVQHQGVLEETPVSA